MATLRGRVLLGWLPRDQAVNFLLNDCAFDPPIDSAAAERMWRDYRDRAEAVPERQATLPMRLPLNQAEQAHAQSFLQFLNRQGQHTIREVIKIDLSQLAVIQHVVVTEMAENYGPSVQTTDGWMRTCLPVTIKQGQIRTNFSQGPRMNSAADIDLPHAECILVRDADGKFVVAEMMRHVTVMETNNRLYLTAGYHRSFAKVSTAPTATVPSAVAALDSKTLVVPSPIQSMADGVTTMTAGLGIFGRRAALLADFFVDGFFMDVALRKKRYQLQVRSTWVAMDDTT